MHRTLARSLLLALSLSPLAAQSVAAKRTPAAGDHGMTLPTSVYAFEVRTIDGKDKSLADYRGHTLLIVNTASRCGFTPQYEGLQALYKKYRERGFEVLAFPANNFMHQEPGTNAEIQTFCTTRFHTTFPLFEKLSVKGKDMAPLYQYLTRDSGFPGDIPWNFAKFLVSADGKVVARYGSSTKPLAPELTAAIEKLLPATPATP